MRLIAHLHQLHREHKFTFNKVKFSSQIVTHLQYLHLIWLFLVKKAAEELSPRRTVTTAGC